MILEVAVNERIWRQAVYVYPEHPVHISVSRLVREIIGNYGRGVEFRKLVVTLDEWDKIRRDSVNYLSMFDHHEDRFMGIPLAIEGDPQERFLNRLAPWLNGSRFAVSKAEAVSLAAVSAEPLTLDRIHQCKRWLMHNSSEVAESYLDDIYARHGGTKTPPSQRPPSKLHPLVQLDEAIGRDMTKGEE